jgi:predicted O-methyltransferase YrrM
MLKETKEKLAALYAGGQHPGTDGQLHTIDSTTRIDQQQGEAIAALHQSVRPNLSIEIGFAYGFSTLHILDAMKKGRYGRHIAIDPFQKTLWHGIGIRAVQDTGLAPRFSGRFRWIEEHAAYALSKMAREKTRIQFVYIDGSHLFNDALTDFCLSDKLMDIGGLALLDDLWMPAVQRVAAFISRNMACYERVDSGHKNLACFRKSGWDERSWDHYAEF